MSGELLHAFSVLVELPSAESAKSFSDTSPGTGFYGVDTLFQPAPQDPLIEGLPVDDDVVQAVHRLALAPLRQPLGTADGQIE